MGWCLTALEFDEADCMTQAEEVRITPCSHVTLMQMYKAADLCEVMIYIRWPVGDPVVLPHHEMTIFVGMQAG